MDKNLEKEHLKQFTYHFFFVHGIYEEIIDIENFITSTDKFLAENLQTTKKDSKTSENTNPRFHPEIQFENIFPDILWRTTFLHSYFLLESSLDQVCKNIQQAEEYTLGLTDIAGNGIFRASVYLKKVCKIKDPFSDNLWSKLVDYNKLRNIFVHSDGLVSRKIAVDLAKRNEGLLIAIVDFDKIAIRFSKDFTLKALQTIDSFFHTLHESMQKSRLSNIRIDTKE